MDKAGFLLSSMSINFASIIISAIILLNTNNDIGRKKELTMLRFMLSGVIAMALCDMVWKLNDTKLVEITPLLNAVFTAINMFSISFICVYWLLFSETKSIYPKNLGNIYYILSKIWLLVSGVVCFSSIKTGWIFKFSAWGLYQRGDYYLIYSIIHIIFITIGSIHILSQRTDSISVDERTSLAMFCVPIIFAFVFQNLAEGTYIISLGFCLSLLFVFVNIQSTRIFNDALTGLNNKRKLEVYFKKRLSYTNEKNPFYYFMIDVNYFKTINDNYGHDEGDRALVLISDAIKKTANQYKCFAARFGGDEFVMITGDANGISPKDIKRALDRNLMEIGKVAKVPYILSLSSGYSKCVNKSATQKDLMQRADKMLYLDKERKHKMLEEMGIQSGR